MTLVIRDIMLGNPRLKELGYYEESLGRNAIAGGFQGQRMWSDWQPVGDFAESILSSTFDWTGARRPTVLATENDNLNGVSMLLGQLMTNGASVFADVRTYWSPEAIERVSGWKPDGMAKDGFIHLINSGAVSYTHLDVYKRQEWDTIVYLSSADTRQFMGGSEESPVSSA